MDKNLIENKMLTTLSHFKKEINGLRTGRASVALVDSISVDAYGSKLPLNQVGNISVPESRLITIQVWDQELVNNVEKAIMDSDLGITPQTEGVLIRLPLPDLDEERRKELSKIASKYAEDNKVSLRNIRREFIDKFKKEQKDNLLSEDELKKHIDEIQKITDKNVNEIDEILKSKQEEIMKV
ncbi:MAG: ribosome recycling factor [Pelagibacteraceae bacterium]|nr:ribosome recycling factor [Pelagibacteraceae bacterium]|tara:strand:+ start:8264 stop:8812 length:549 start_codon:yes stop_codon:yes gene_type:complete